MKVIVGKRMTGKTSELIRLADTSLPGVRYIVCHDRAAATHAVRRAKSMEIDILFPLIYEELPVGQGSGITHLLIDNVQAFLTWMCHCWVFAVSCDIEHAGEIKHL